MSYPAMVFRVMIATPSDVQAERGIIRDAIHEWNIMHSTTARVVLLPIGWETHSVPTIGERPQEALNEQMVRDCDLLVAVFWTRLGTDTGKAESGTVEEINEHVNAGKPAMLYFSNTPVMPSSIDQAQYAALTAFKNSYKGKSLFHEYGSHEQFRTDFTRQLVMKVQDALLPGVPASDLIEERLSIQTSLSEDAQRLLLAAAGHDGTVLCVHCLRGVSVQAAGQNMCEGNSRREIARWKGALEELRNCDLVRDRGHKGEVFEVTQKGYQLADQLKQG